jgi:hypothetical protein
MVQTSLVVPLAPAGTERRMERQHQLNIGGRKIFRAGRTEYSIEVNLFNALNADTIYGVSSNNFGTAAYTVPSQIIQGRLPRLGFRVKW